MRPVCDYLEIHADEHAAHMRLVRPLQLPNGIATKTVAFQVNLAGYEFEIVRSPPELGKHNSEVFQEWTSRTPSE